MLKRIGKYIAEKVTQNVASIAVTCGFWTAVAAAGPVTVVGTVGVPIFAVAAVTVHSGIFEYVAIKGISNYFKGNEEI